jgi:hypothetical protein
MQNLIMAGLLAMEDAGMLLDVLWNVLFVPHRNDECVSNISIWYTVSFSPEKQDS